jgi:ABC-2 type transport system permease protein
MSAGETPAGQVALPRQESRKESPRWAKTLELMWQTSVFDFRRRYAETALGLAWGIIEPVAYSLVLYLIFTRGLRFGGTIPNYIGMLMLNVILFRSFREGTRNAMRALFQKRAMVNVRVPKPIVVLSGIFSAILVLGIALPVAFAWVLGDGVKPTLTWLLFPVMLLYLLLCTVVVGFVLAAFFAHWRDTALVWSLYGRILFLTSGVVFPYEIVRGEVFQAIAAWNPIVPLFVQARVWMIDPSAPTWPEAAGSTLYTWAPFITLGVLVILGLLTFRPWTRRVAEV